jgi:hypothetical protein
MPRISSAALIACVVVTCGCAATTMTVGSHVREGLTLAPYHTYDWGPADALPTGDPRLDRDPVFQDRVQGAVEKQFASKGIERSGNGHPDLLVHYHASIDKRIDVNRTEHEYGYCQNGGCDSWIVEYEAGTLVLDVVDARTSQLIWRGWAQDSVEDALGNDARMAQKINDAVNRMFARFPRR